MNGTHSLFRRVKSKRMWASDIERLKRLTAYIRQYYRIKFESEPPQEYVDVGVSVETLLPLDAREDSYANYELIRPSHIYLGETISSCLEVLIRKTMSNAVRCELKRIVGLRLFEPADYSDVSSVESADTPPQQVPDEHEPHAKQNKKDNQSTFK